MPLDKIIEKYPELEDITEYLKDKNNDGKSYDVQKVINYFDQKY